MGTGKETYSDSTTVRAAIQTLLDDDLTEIFAQLAAIAAGSGVIVSANDTVVGVLNGKLVAGNRISLTEGNDGGDETLTIALTDPDIVVADAASLGTGATDGQLRVCADNGNVYTWDDGNSKWRICSGNIYAADPSAVTYTVETGTTIWVTGDSQQKVYNGSAWVEVVALSPGDVYGLVCSNDTDADHDVNVTAGGIRDDTDVRNLVLPSEITKQIDGAWAVGDDAPGLDAGSVAANTIYHVFLIKRSDTGVVDVLFSTSADSPTMPANYDYKRWLFYVVTDSSSNIQPFTQVGGGQTVEMWLKSSVSVASGLSGAGTQSVTAYIPYASGFCVSALFSCGPGADNNTMSVASASGYSGVSTQQITGGANVQGVSDFIPLVASTVYYSCSTSTGSFSLRAVRIVR